jgi:hypothetical protein
MKSLLASLTDHPMALLRGIAELRGVELGSNVRTDAAAQLASALAELASTASALAACSPAAQKAWRALIAAGGHMKMPVFVRSHGDIRPVGPGRLEREATWRQPESPAEELWYRGLIFRAFADLGDGPLEYVYSPDDVPAPPDADPAPEAGPAQGIASVPAPAKPRQAFNSLAVDMCAVLAALRETPGQVDKAGHLQQTHADRLRSALLLDDAARFDLLMASARGQGWLKVDRDRLVLDTQAASAWLRATHWEQMSVLFRAWRESSDWHDLRHVPSLRAEGDWRSDPLLARRAVLDSLRELAPGAWYAITDFVAGIKARNPDFQRPDGDYTRWYLRDAESGRYLSGFESWDDVEGRLIRFLITGPLFWLGAVALEEAPGKETSVFRVTALGAGWLSGRTPAELPRPARPSVGDDFIVIAPLTLPLLDRFRLLRFTELAAGPYEFGQPTRHRITRGSLARARAGGVKAEALLEFLQRATGGRVPPRVVSALARWDQHGGAIRVSQGAVLRVEDASILAALRADPAVAPLLGDLLSAQAVLVKETNLPRLLAAVQEMGYNVKLD